MAGRAEDRLRGGRRRAAKQSDMVRCWQRVLQDQRRSGLSQSAFCRQQGIALSTYFWWKRRLRDGDSALGIAATRSASDASASEAHLVPVHVTRPEHVLSAAFAEAAYELVVPDGLIVRIPVRFDAESLERLLRLVLRPCSA